MVSFIGRLLLVKRSRNAPPAQRRAQPSHNRRADTWSSTPDPSRAAGSFFGQLRSSGIERWKAGAGLFAVFIFLNPASFATNAASMNGINSATLSAVP
jgi:hypothetical protein